MYGDPVVPARRRRRRPATAFLLSTTSSDSHTWNLMFLQLLLEERGHEVVNLGPCVPDDLLVETARSCRPSAIVISTVNGHGRIDGARVAQAVRQDPETAQLPMMIGGKLGIEGTEQRRRGLPPARGRVRRRVHRRREPRRAADHPEPDAARAGGRS